VLIEIIQVKEEISMASTLLMGISKDEHELALSLARHRGGGIFPKIAVYFITQFLSWQSTKNGKIDIKTIKLPFMLF